MADKAAQEALARFLDWLDERCIFLRHLEKEASTVAQSGDSPRYRQLMLHKALFLEAMDGEAEPELRGIPAAAAETARACFARFAKSARQSMDLDSPFYMSALLYPEDHQPGQPNDLEALRAELAAHS
jgi:hypothetical protein